MYLTCQIIVRPPTSAHAECSAEAEARARFAAMRSQCDNIVIFHRKGIPSNVPAPAHVIFQSAAVNNAENNTPVSGSEITPWHPVLAAIALQCWPWFDNALRKARLRKMQLERKTTPPPVIIIDQDGIVHSATPTAPTIPGQLEFEFDGMRPGSDRGKSPVEAIILPSDLMVTDLQIEEDSSGPVQDAAQDEAQLANNLNKRKGMQLPSLISISDSRTPLIQTTVRRSNRLSTGKEGFRQVRIDKEPSKRTKQWAVEVDEKTGEIKPISVSTLRGWGIDCGVDPMDLTDEAFFQAPPPQEPVDDEASDPGGTRCPISTICFDE